MALIKKYINLTVNGNKSILNQPIYLFQNDKDIDLVFTIINLKFDFVRNIQMEEDLVESLGASYFRVKVLKPDNDDEDKEYISELFEITDNRVTFNIDDTFIFDEKDYNGSLPSEENDKIGKYKLQIQLYDENQSGRITIPAIEFEVLEPIFYDDVVINLEEGIVDISKIGECSIGEEVVEIASAELTNRMASVMANVDKSQVEDESYLREWVKGQIIDSTRMNTIHANIEYLRDKVSDLTADKISYDNEDYPTIKDALDSLLYVAPTVTSLTANQPTLVEMGTIINNTVFNWTYNKSIIYQSFNGVALSSELRTYTYTETISSTTTLTLSANDGKNSCSRGITITYANRVFYGVSSSTNYDSTLLDSLPYVLSNSRSRSISVDAGVGQYIVYAVPTRLGKCEFTVGGFEGGFENVATISYTNPQNYMEYYYIYKSVNASLGNTTVKIT